jgi:hypothetical protein
MNALHRRKSNLIALFVAVAAFVPGIGHAATGATVNSLTLYGDSRTDRANTAWDDRKVIFPNSLPNAGNQTSGASDMERVHFKGNATWTDATNVVHAANSVVVTVSDGVGAITGSYTPAAVTDGDVTAGDFSGSIQATQLGVHLVDLKPDGTPVVNANAFPAPADQLAYLSHLGKSTLTVTAQAFDANGATTGIYVDGATSAAPTIDKYAAAPGDGAPISTSSLTGVAFPPNQWCHNPGAFKGAVFYNFVFTSGSAGGGLPVCNSTEYRGYQQQSPIGNFCGPWGVRVSVAQLDSCYGFSIWGARGEEPIRGIVNDLLAGTGRASEIANIQLRVLQGPNLAGATEVPNTREDNILRFGPQAVWSKNQKVDNLAPNWPNTASPTAQACTNACYFFQVTITDAWNNVVLRTSGATTIYPY